MSRPEYTVHINLPDVYLPHTSYDFSYFKDFDLTSLYCIRLWLGVRRRMPNLKTKGLTWYDKRMWNSICDSSWNLCLKTELTLVLTLTEPQNSYTEFKRKLSKVVFEPAKPRSTANTLLLSPPSSIQNYGIMTYDSLSKYESPVWRHVVGPLVFEIQHTTSDP